VVATILCLWRAAAKDRQRARTRGSKISAYFQAFLGHFKITTHDGKIGGDEANCHFAYVKGLKSDFSDLISSVYLSLPSLRHDISDILKSDNFFPSKFPFSEKQ
jgi:hypothetical protein